jgi:hypothetical protein
MDNLKGIIFQGCPQWSFQFMQGFLSSGTLGFYCTKNIVAERLIDSGDQHLLNGALQYRASIAE